MDADIEEYAIFLGVDPNTEKVRRTAGVTTTTTSACLKSACCGGLRSKRNMPNTLPARGCHTCMQDLYYIAREGLKFPLPGAWKPW